MIGARRVTWRVAHLDRGHRDAAGTPLLHLWWSHWWRRRSRLSARPV